MEMEQRWVGTGVSPLFGESYLFKRDLNVTNLSPPSV